MPRRRLVLASASPARLRLLRDAGFDPRVEVSGVDESLVSAATPTELVATLARDKAVTVAGRLARRGADALVLGCDSALAIDGAAHGKPSSSAVAVERWRAQRGRTGELLTGHALLAVSGGTAGPADVRVARTSVRFGTPSDAEIDAYVATGEPLAVAGGFTLDGRGGLFIDGIDGDPSNVIGLSLPLLRRMLADRGIEATELWD